MGASCNRGVSECIRPQEKRETPSMDLPAHPVCSPTVDTKED
jgi:hypothetical protein